MNKREEAFDAVDATVFSSDMFFSDADYQSFKAYLARWNRAVAEHEGVALSAPPTVQPSDAELLAAVAEAGWMARPSDASMLRDAHEILSGRPPVGISRQTASPQAEAPVPPAGATEGEL